MTENTYVIIIIASLVVSIFFICLGGYFHDYNRKEKQMKKRNRKRRLKNNEKFKPFRKYFVIQRPVSETISYCLGFAALAPGFLSIGEVMISTAERQPWHYLVLLLMPTVLIAWLCLSSYRKTVVDGNEITIFRPFKRAKKLSFYDITEIRRYFIRRDFVYKVFVGNSHEFTLRDTEYSCPLFIERAKQYGHIRHK